MTVVNAIVNDGLGPGLGFHCLVVAKARSDVCDGGKKITNWTAAAGPPDLYKFSQSTESSDAATSTWRWLAGTWGGGGIIIFVFMPGPIPATKSKIIINICRTIYVGSR